MSAELLLTPTAGPFGLAPFSVLRRPAAVPGDVDLDGVVRAFASEELDPTLFLAQCEPTAAFSRRDVLLPGYPAAVETARAHGFVPVVRPVGGHLAAYDEGSLVLHLWAPHWEPRLGIEQRFRQVGHALVAGLTELGVPEARVGPVQGEYCDGAWSVNLGGRVKVAGTGQRVNRHRFLLCAVLTVTAPTRIREVLTRTYADLGLAFDPATVGCLSDWVPGVCATDVRDVVGAALCRILPSALTSQSSEAVDRPRLAMSLV